MSPVQVAQALPARLPRWYGRWFVFCLGRLLSMQSACVHAVHDVMLRVWARRVPDVRSTSKLIASTAST